MRGLHRLKRSQIDNFRLQTKKAALSDGGGLTLVFSRTLDGRQTQSWVLRHTKSNGKPGALGLGSYPDVSLEEAREKAATARKQLRDGVDPVEEKKRLRAQGKAKCEKAKADRQPTPTFRQISLRYWNNKKAGREDWTEFEAQMMRAFQLHVYPVPVGDTMFGDLPIDQVDTKAIKAFMTSMWKSWKQGGKAKTADKLLGKIRAVIGFADFHELRHGQKNPAEWSGHLENGFVPVEEIAPTKNLPAVAPGGAYRFMQQLRTVDTVAARALELLILTAVRTGCILGAEWQQFDFSRQEWEIPPELMKTRKKRWAPHWVPLDQRMFDVLAKVNPLAGKQPVTGRVFDIDPHEMHALCERIALKVTGNRAVPHGWRATFKSWGRDNGKSRELIETALAHVIGGKVEEGYDRPETHKYMLAGRRRLMPEWGEFLSQPKEEQHNVVPFRTTA
jgi:integrase